MKSATVAAVALALSATAGVACAAPSSIEGDWLTPSKHAVIQLYDCGADVCGRVVSSDDLTANPELRDIHNKSAALQGRPIKGLVMITGMKGGPTEWTGGSLYDPLSGNTYHGSVTLRGPDTADLKGCIIGPLCRSQTWKRVR